MGLLVMPTKRPTQTTIPARQTWTTIPTRQEWMKIMTIQKISLHMTPMMMR